MSALCRVLLLPCHIAFCHHSCEKLLLQCKKCAIRQPLNRRLISNHTTACIAIVFVQTVFQEWNFAWRSVSSNVLSETKQDQHCCRIRHQSLLKKKSFIHAVWPANDKEKGIHFHFSSPCSFKKRVHSSHNIISKE